eukprot:5300880-Prymnesium_polylepis.2
MVAARRHDGGRASGSAPPGWIAGSREWARYLPTPKTPPQAAARRAPWRRKDPAQTLRGVAPRVHTSHTRDTIPALRVARAGFAPPSHHL